MSEAPTKPDLEFKVGISGENPKLEEERNEVVRQWKE